MSASISPHAPTGTPVWVEVRENLWLAGKTLAEPYRAGSPLFMRRVEPAIWRVEVAIGDDEHDYPLARVQRRRAKR